MRLSDRFHPTPPAMQPMQRAAQSSSNNTGHYDSQGRFCAPETEISFSALQLNISALHAHQQTQWSEEAENRRLIDEKFAELERNIKDAISLMHYTAKYHPNVIQEFEAAKRTKVRIGVDAPVT